MTARLHYDPMGMVIDAFNELYPGKVARVTFQSDLQGSDGCEGFTLFPDDGGEPVIVINADMALAGVVETIAHELAHVAEPKDEHGPLWEAAFIAIHKKYMEKLDAVPGPEA